MREIASVIVREEGIEAMVESRKGRDDREVWVSQTNFFFGWSGERKLGGNCIGGVACWRAKNKKS
jgi:hypothetical protein